MEDNFQKVNDYDYVGFWSRVLASFLDALILLPLMFLSLNAHKSAIVDRVFWPLIVLMCVSYLYQLYFIVRHGGTPGKLMTKMRIIDESGNYLSILKALIRLLPAAIYSIVNISSMLVAGWEMATILSSLSHLLSVCYIVNVLFVAFTAKKRALHDYMAGSYVVTKDSLFNQDEKELEI